MGCESTIRKGKQISKHQQTTNLGVFLSEKRKGRGIFPRKWLSLIFSTKHAHGKSVQECSTEETRRLSTYYSCTHVLMAQCGFAAME